MYPVTRPSENSRRPVGVNDLQPAVLHNLLLSLGNQLPERQIPRQCDFETCHFALIEV